MTSLPSSTGSIFSSLIVFLQVIQEISVRSGLRSSFIEAHLERPQTVRKNKLCSGHAAEMGHAGIDSPRGFGMERQQSSLERQAADALRRARKLPIGPDRNDLRQLAVGLLWLHRNGCLKDISSLSQSVSNEGLP
jgi:hypothetical protein